MIVTLGTVVCVATVVYRLLLLEQRVADLEATPSSEAGAYFRPVARPAPRAESPSSSKGQHGEREEEEEDEEEDEEEGEEEGEEEEAPPPAASSESLASH